MFGYQSVHALTSCSEEKTRDKHDKKLEAVFSTKFWKAANAVTVEVLVTLLACLEVSLVTRVAIGQCCSFFVPRESLGRFLSKAYIALGMDA